MQRWSIVAFALSGSWKPVWRITFILSPTKVWVLTGRKTFLFPSRISSKKIMWKFKLGSCSIPPSSFLIILRGFWCDRRKKGSLFHLEEAMTLSWRYNDKSSWNCSDWSVLCPWALLAERSVHYYWHFLTHISSPFFSTRMSLTRILIFCIRSQITKILWFQKR